MSLTEVTSPKPLAAPGPARSAEWVNSRYLGLTLTLLFLTAAGVQNAIVLTWINVTGGNSSQPGNIYGLALIFAQTGLVALHCGFSRQHIALRTALFLATVLVSGDLASRYDGRTGLQGTWMIALLAHGLFVLVLTWWLRVNGCRLVQGGEQPTDSPIRWQFNLLRLFGVTTIAAIVLGVFSRFKVNTELLPHMVYEATILALLPLQVCFCVLKERRFSTMVITGFGTVCGLGVVLGLIVPGNDVLSMLWRTFVQSLMLHAALSIVRQAGYQMVEREKKKPAA